MILFVWLCSQSQPRVVVEGVKSRVKWCQSWPSYLTVGTRMWIWAWIWQCLTIVLKAVLAMLLACRLMAGLFMQSCRESTESWYSTEWHRCRAWAAAWHKFHSFRIECHSWYPGSVHSLLLESAFRHIRYDHLEDHVGKSVELAKGCTSGWP